jgi:hypothetical protein
MARLTGILVVKQVFEGCKRRIVAFLAMTAILQVQILTTFNAKTFALKIMQGLDRDFQQCIFANKGCEVDMGIFG